MGRKVHTRPARDLQHHDAPIFRGHDGCLFGEVGERPVNEPIIDGQDDEEKGAGDNQGRCREGGKEG